MKNFVGVLCLILFCSVASAEGQNVESRVIDLAMNRLVKVKSISNYDPGFGTENEFYKLSQEFLKTHHSSDFRRMVNQRNPIVRAMGLLCLTQTNRDESLFVLLSHWNDAEEIYLHQGCIVSRLTVGEFVQRLFLNAHFLDPST